MAPLGISLLVFCSLVAGGALGLLLRRRLPAHHLANDSKDAIKLATGLIGTMAALLLGLLVASAKNSYDTDNSEVVQLAAKITFLDRMLANFGPQAGDARRMLHEATQRAIDQMWPPQPSEATQLDPLATHAEGMYEALHKLAPANEMQTVMKAKALDAATDIAQLRWLILSQNGSSISTPLLVVMVFWLTVVFMSFTLFVEPNLTVIITLLLCAVSVSGAIFLVLELDEPFGGLLRIPSDAMRMALDHLGK
jgi:hypothetical protein